MSYKKNKPHNWGKNDMYVLSSFREAMRIVINYLRVSDYKTFVYIAKDDRSKLYINNMSFCIVHLKNLAIDYEILKIRKLLKIEMWYILKIELL